MLAFSTNAFKKNTLEEAITSIADLGYTGVELMADLHHAYPPTFGAAARARIKQLLKDRNLTVSNINAFTHFADGDTYHPTWIEDDATLRRKRIRHTLDCIRLAHEFGSKTVSLQPGGPTIGTYHNRGSAAELFAEGLHEVLPLAKELNITLAIEPEPGLLIQTAEESRAFKKVFFKDEPLIRMNCDVGHLYCVGDDPAEIITSMPEEISHVHLEDIGKNRVHQHLTPGKGAIDFPSIFKSLKDVHYNGWVTVELYPYETTAAGVARMAMEHLKSLRLV